MSAKSAPCVQLVSVCLPGFASCQSAARSITARVSAFPLGRGDAGLGGAGGQTAEHKQGTKQEAHGRIFCMSQRRLDAKSGLAGS